MVCLSKDFLIWKIIGFILSAKAEAELVWKRSFSSRFQTGKQNGLDLVKAALRSSKVLAAH